MNRARAREDLESERKYHEREWLVERLGWCVLLGFVIAALLGLFGDGPLSRRVVGDGKSASLQYERFGRYASPTLLEVSLATAPGADLNVEISAAYLSEFELRSIVPEPNRTALAGEFYRFTFAATQVPTTIAIRLAPEGMGRKRGIVRVAGKELPIDQFIYP